MERSNTETYSCNHPSLSWNFSSKNAISANLNTILTIVVCVSDPKYDKGELAVESVEDFETKAFDEVKSCSSVVLACEMTVIACVYFSTQKMSKNYSAASLYVPSLLLPSFSYFLFSYFSFSSVRCCNKHEEYMFTTSQKTLAESDGFKSCRASTKSCWEKMSVKKFHRGKRAWKKVTEFGAKKSCGKLRTSARLKNPLFVKEAAVFHIFSALTASSMSSFKKSAKNLPDKKKQPKKKPTQKTHLLVLSCPLLFHSTLRLPYNIL